MEWHHQHLDRGRNRGHWNKPWELRHGDRVCNQGHMDRAWHQEHRGNGWNQGHCSRDWNNGQRDRGWSHGYGHRDLPSYRRHNSGSLGIRPFNRAGWSDSKDSQKESAVRAVVASGEIGHKDERTTHDAEEDQTNNINPQKTGDQSEEQIKQGQDSGNNEGELEVDSALEINQKIDMERRDEEGQGLVTGCHVTAQNNMEDDCSMEGGINLEAEGNMDNGSNMDVCNNIEAGNNMEDLCIMKPGNNMETRCNVEDGSSRNVGSNLEEISSIEAGCNAEPGSSIETGSNLEAGGNIEDGGASGEVSSMEARVNRKALKKNLKAVSNTETGYNIHAVRDRSNMETNSSMRAENIISSNNHMEAESNIETLRKIEAGSISKAGSRRKSRSEGISWEAETDPVECGVSSWLVPVQKWPPPPSPLFLPSPVSSGDQSDTSCLPLKNSISDETHDLIIQHHQLRYQLNRQTATSTGSLHHLHLLHNQILRRFSDSMLKNELILKLNRPVEPLLIAGDLGVLGAVHSVHPFLPSYVYVRFWQVTPSSCVSKDVRRLLPSWARLYSSTIIPRINTSSQKGDDLIFVEGRRKPSRSGAATSGHPAATTTYSRPTVTTGPASVTRETGPRRAPLPPVEIGDFIPNSNGLFKVKFRNRGPEFLKEAEVVKFFSRFGIVASVHAEDGRPCQEDDFIVEGMLYVELTDKNSFLLACSAQLGGQQIEVARECLSQRGLEKFGYIRQPSESLENTRLTMGQERCWMGKGSDSIRLSPSEKNYQRVCGSKESSPWTCRHCGSVNCDEPVAGICRECTAFLKADFGDWSCMNCGKWHRRTRTISCCRCNVGKGLWLCWKCKIQNSPDLTVCKNKDCREKRLVDDQYHRGLHASSIQSDLSPDQPRASNQVKFYSDRGRGGQGSCRDRHDSRGDRGIEGETAKPGIRTTCHSSHTSPPDTLTQSKKMLRHGPDNTRYVSETARYRADARGTNEGRQGSVNVCLGTVTSRHGMDMARYSKDTARHNTDPARHNTDTARHNTDTARHNTDTARRCINTARHNTNTDRHGTDTTSNSTETGRDNTDTPRHGVDTVRLCCSQCGGFKGPGNALCDKCLNSSSTLSSATQSSVWSRPSSRQGFRNESGGMLCSSCSQIKNSSHSLCIKCLRREEVLQEEENLRHLARQKIQQKQEQERGKRRQLAADSTPGREDGKRPHYDDKDDMCTVSSKARKTDWEAEFERRKVEVERERERSERSKRTVANVQSRLLQLAGGYDQGTADCDDANSELNSLAAGKPLLAEIPSTREKEPEIINLSESDNEEEMDEFSNTLNNSKAEKSTCRNGDDLIHELDKLDTLQGKQRVELLEKFGIVEIGFQESSQRSSALNHRTSEAKNRKGTGEVVMSSPVCVDIPDSDDDEAGKYSCGSSVAGEDNADLSPQPSTSDPIEPTACSLVSHTENNPGNDSVFTSGIDTPLSPGAEEGEDEDIVYLD